MSEIKVVIEGSGKHCHVTRETLDKLYGKGFELEVKKWLSQPGQFATPHKLTVTGPKGKAELSIIGPCRKYDQIELSFTDARALGFDPPVRESGDLKGSPGCTLTGPAGETAIPEGVIVAKRHIHLTPEDAEKFGLKDKQLVQVRVDGERALIFDEVVARVSPEYATYMHVDYDEINAAALFGGDVTGTVLPLRNRTLD
ncbi:MAG: phosphate propanoyltransferase [Oscillospiraceae bacterium]|jgi:putative phosphotransacetylase|nr:phosphate propanoyltransferase [Oscillospiraceae bacterium]